MSGEIQFLMYVKGRYNQPYAIEFQEESVRKLVHPRRNTRKLTKELTLLIQEKKTILNCKISFMKLSIYVLTGNENL